jgi:hypothetical protein
MIKEEERLKKQAEERLEQMNQSHGVLYNWRVMKMERMRKENERMKEEMNKKLELEMEKQKREAERRDEIAKQLEEYYQLQESRRLKGLEIEKKIRENDLQEQKLIKKVFVLVVLIWLSLMRNEFDTEQAS